MKTTGSEAACPELASAWLLACSLKSETILLAMRRLPVCRPSAAPPQSCFRAETILSPTGDWGCIKPLRNALHQFARPRTLQEEWALAYYERKRARCGKSHSVAVRALSNIWARIIFAMLQSHEPSDRTTFEKARHLHAPKAA